MFSSTAMGSSRSSPTSYSSWSPSTERKYGEPVHPASLVDCAMHSPSLMQLIDIKLSQTVIEYVVHCVSETVAHAMQFSGATLSNFPSPRPSLPGASRQRHASFVASVLSRAEVATPTVLVTLAYLVRARPHIAIALETWAFERVFLGALIVAAKYTTDSTLKNAHWALCTTLFGKRDVGRIEREFLEVLDWDLGVAEQDLLVHYTALMRAADGYSIAQTAPNRFIRDTPIPGSDASHSYDRHCPCPSPHDIVPELSPSSPQSNLDTDSSLSPHTPPEPIIPLVEIRSTAHTAKSTKSTHEKKLHNFLHILHHGHRHQHRSGA